MSFIANDLISRMFLSESLGLLSLPTSPTKSVPTESAPTSLAALFRDFKVSLKYRPIKPGAAHDETRIAFFLTSRYFQRRYAAGGEGNFDGLSHRDFEIETARRISLMLQRPRTVAEHARCVAYICWRMRNNIFHGNKNFNEIATQADLINAAAEGLQGIAIALGLARDFED